MSQINQNNLDLHNNGEQMVWKGSSSQLLNFKHYGIAVIVIAASVWAALHFDNNYILLVALLAAFYALYQFLIVNSASYTLTNQRIIRRYGLFNRTTFEIELYRVKDVHLYEPLQLRMFGLGTISLISSQRSTQIFELTAIKNAVEIREQLRHLVERRRNEKGVGEYDTN
jgi:membrane protein YdbS with pleckstrin-like domain